MSDEAVTNCVIESLLLDDRKWGALNDIDPCAILPVLCRVVEREGCFPVDAKQEMNGQRLIFGPAITQESNGTYSIHNCCFFVLSKDDQARKRERCSLKLEDAVRLFLIAEPFGNYRGYAWTHQYEPSRNL